MQPRNKIITLGTYKHKTKLMNFIKNNFYHAKNIYDTYKIKCITKNVYKIKNYLQSESTTTPDTNVKASLIYVSGNFSAPWFYVI